MCNIKNSSAPNMGSPKRWSIHVLVLLQMQPSLSRSCPKVHSSGGSGREFLRKMNRGPPAAPCSEQDNRG